jgi:hypothetical protein
MISALRHKGDSTGGQDLIRNRENLAVHARRLYDLAGASPNMSCASIRMSTFVLIPKVNMFFNSAYREATCLLTRDRHKFLVLIEAFSAVSNAVENIHRFINVSPAFVQSFI